MAVNRCVCWEVPFKTLWRLHTEEGLDFDGLVERTNCCTGCTTCEPYVRLMLKTGETDLPVLTARELAEALKEPPA